jgi:hypothetical protein
MYAFAPEKTPSLVGRNFCLAIPRVFAKASNKMDSQKRITPPKYRKELAGSYCAAVRLKYASSRSVNGVKAL